MWEAYQRSDRNAFTSNANKADFLNDEYEELKEKYQVVVEENKIVNRKLQNSKEKRLELGSNLLSATKQLLNAIMSNSVTEDVVTNAKQSIKQCENYLNENIEYKKESKGEHEESKDEFDEELNKKLLQKNFKKAEEYHESEHDDSNIHRKESEEVKEKVYDEKSIQELKLLDFPELDYKKITVFLSSSKDDLKICALLQALTWRIVKKKMKYDKIAVINEYVNNDLLNCNNNGQTIKRLLGHTNKKYIAFNMSIELFTMP